MAKVKKPKQRWPGPSKNKKQRETRKKPMPIGLMNYFKNDHKGKEGKLVCVGDKFGIILE